jgi:hypothetical protein
MRLLAVLLLLATSAFAQQTPAPEPSQAAPAASCSKGALLAPSFDDTTADCILGPIQQGLISRNPRQILSVFDKKQFEGYESLEDQLAAMFERYAGIRASYRIVSTKAEGSHATLVAEFDVEESGRDNAYPPVRKRQQVRFELERGEKGWKVVDYLPRGFFA